MSDKRVARLMRERTIHGASRRKGFTTTVRNRDARPAPDLVDRKFVATAQDQLWVADITYVPTAIGFLFVAIVLDVFSRRVVGWALASRGNVAAQRWFGLHCRAHDRLDCGLQVGAAQRFELALRLAQLVQDIERQLRLALTPHWCASARAAATAAWPSARPPSLHGTWLCIRTV